MRKLLQINAICVVISMLINIFPCVVGAESSLWKNMNGLEIFNLDDSAALQEEINNENNYVEPCVQLIVRYINSEGEKVEDGIFVSPFFDTIQVASNIDVDSYIDDLKSDNDNISYIQKDYKLILSATEKEIDLSTETLNINNAIATIRPLNPDDVFADDISVEYSDSALSNDIIVAVIDSGIDIEHEALKDNIFVNEDETKNDSGTDNNGYIDDVSGWDFVNNTNLSYDHTQIVEYSHGTHVAGIIAGNSDEIQGVHSNAKILPLKAFESGSGYTSNIIKAINYAEQIGAKVVNCSFGSSDNNEALKETMENSDMLFVCAAGNQAKNIDKAAFYPASFDLNNIISVGAIDTDNNLAYFSNYGEAIDIAVNGMSVKSSIPENEYGNSSGTSSSAAYISGIIANILLDNNELQIPLLKDYLLTSTQDTTLINGTPSNIKSLYFENQISTISEETSNVDEIGLTDTNDENALLTSTLQRISQISAGGYHSSVMVDNSAYIFGNLAAMDGNYYWGDNDVSAPGYKMFGVKPPYGTSKSFVVRKISTRGDHNLILLSDGTVRSIGMNNYGQLGVGYVDGYIGDGYESTWQVLGLTNIVDIAAGHQFSMALDSSGRVYVWGNNKDGQVGNGSSYPFYTTPQLVTGISNINQISAGHYHALAQTQSGTVYGWGRASNSALGSQTSEKCYTPTVLDVTNVDKIVAGINNSFFIKSDKTVYACGSNAYGQLGDGTLNSRTDITQINIDNVEDVSSNTATVFLKADGTVYGCGLNAYGELGLGYTSTTVKSITKIPGNYTAVSTGGNHTLFLNDNGLYAAGRNQCKQCGFSNTEINYLSPTLIPEFASDAFSLDSIYVDNGMLTLSGICKFGDASASIYIGDDYLYAETSIYYAQYLDISTTNNSYTVSYTPNSLKTGLNKGWIKLYDFPYKIYFSFYYEPSGDTVINEINIQKGDQYIVAVNANIANIHDKVFTVTYDNSKLSLDDICAQTWKKDKIIGNITDTDITLLSKSNSQIQFKVNKPLSSISGTINLIGFKALTNGTTKITVTAQ
ncbi:S8 family serine peptidase [Lachnospiraceae bacterium MD329]|nr:S8 family serine peptidase [Lachnospiraceae bacterium MD329]